MYGVIHDSIFDSSLRDSWQALVVFIVLITLADEEDVVDMTTSALAARSGLPLGVVTEGIAVLEKPDPMSRTPDCDGRRITRLDDHRPWGWRVVNRAAYKRMRDKEERRAYMRDLMRKRRHNVGDAEPVSTLLADVSLGRRQETGDSREQRSVAEPSARATAIPLGASAADNDLLPHMIGLPTNKKGMRVAIMGHEVTRWQEQFPAVDVTAELRKIQAWLEANPERRKTARGMHRFIVRWLSKEQDKGHALPAVQAPKEMTPEERARRERAAREESARRLAEVAALNPTTPDPEVVERFERLRRGETTEGGE